MGTGAEASMFSLPSFEAGERRAKSKRDARHDQCCDDQPYVVRGWREKRDFLLLSLPMYVEGLEMSP